MPSTPLLPSATGLPRFSFDPDQHLELARLERENHPALERGWMRRAAYKRLRQEQRAVTRALKSWPAFYEIDANRYGRAHG